MPALLMRMSRRLNCRRAERKRASTECGSRTSPGGARAGISADASSLLTCANADWSRAVRIRLQPSAARARAVASPMPRVAPVTRATWPRRRGGDDLNVLLEVRFVKLEVRESAALSYIIRQPDQKQRQSQQQMQLQRRHQR